MATITLRSTKGSPLTNNEVDANFTNLNTDKAELSGATFTGNLSLGDNVKLQLGNQTNGDLQLYHDGNHSWIKDAGAGNIYISSDGYAVNIVKGENTAAVASFIPDGPVNLYNAGNLRLATTSTGISISNDANFPDNGKAIFGAGDDLQIYHDGSASYIADVGTGDLVLQAGNDLILRQPDGSTEYLRANEGAGVQIYHNGSQKFLTTSTGIDVTGTATADGLTVSDSQAGGVTAQIQNSNSTQTGGSRLDFLFSGSTVTGRIQNRFNGADFQTDWYTGNHGLEIFTDLAKTEKRLDIAHNGDISFYEDTGTTAKLFWDASAESLGIGTGSPDKALTISASDSQVRLYDADGTNQFASFQSDNGIAKITSRNNTSHGQIAFQTYNGTAVTERMRIDSSGNLLVGTTTARVAEFGSTYGACLLGQSGNEGQIQSQTNGIFNAIFDRRTSDGGIMQFRKDGTVVGSIGVDSGSYLVIESEPNGSALILEGSDNSGTTTRLAMQNASGSEAFRPFNSHSDALFDLGSSARRFKDLYLSGGVYLGGTGSANKLDDYEEGTFTPVVGGTWTTSPTTLSGTYTKVGNVVTIRMRMLGGVKSSAVSGYITGLPFATNNNYGSVGSVSNTGVADFGNCLFQNTDRIWLTETNFTTGTVWVSGVYETTV